MIGVITETKIKKSIPEKRFSMELLGYIEADTLEEVKEVFDKINKAHKETNPIHQYCGIRYPYLTLTVVTNKLGI